MMLKTRAQASTEFLALAAVGIAVLAVSLVIFSIYSDAASQAQRRLEAEAICAEVSSFVGSFAAAGDGTSADFSLSRPYSRANYTVWLVGGKSLVKVEYELSGKKYGVGCHFPFANVTNGTESTFALAKNFRLNNTDGVVLIAQ